MKPLLEKALQQFDVLSADRSNQHDTAALGAVGHWRLIDSPELAAKVISQALEGYATAEASRIVSWPLYQSMLEAKRSKPVAPKVDDPKFDPAGISYDSLDEREIAKRFRYQKAMCAYGKAIQEYESETEQTDFLKRRFGATVQGYLAFVQDAEATGSASASSAIADFLQEQRPLPIPEATARLGGFIVGNHGSGKSEVIKHRVWHYLTKSDPSETIVVIDPHGEMAPEIARMKPNAVSDRLVYIDPTLDPDFMPCPDLLNTADKSPDNLYREAEYYGSALRMMTRSEELSASGNMESLCRNCAHAVLEDDQFNLADLLDLLAMEVPKKGGEVLDPPEIYRAAIESERR